MSFFNSNTIFNSSGLGHSGGLSDMDLGQENQPIPSVIPSLSLADMDFTVTSAGPLSNSHSFTPIPSTSRTPLATQDLNVPQTLPTSDPFASAKQIQDLFPLSRKRPYFEGEVKEKEEFLPSPKFARTLDESDSSLPSSIKMSHKLAAHLLGGVFALEASLEGQELEGSTFSKILPFIKYVLDLEGKKILSESQIKIIETYINNLLEIESKFSELNKTDKPFKEKSEEFAQWIIAKIKQLKPGETLVIPGGWEDDSAGHAMLYEVTRQKDGRFTLSVYNTGAGLPFHSRVFIDFTVKFQVFVKHENIAEAMLDKTFLWRAIYELENLKPKEFKFDENYIYNGILRSIDENFGIHVARELKEKQSLLDFSNYKTEQSFGNCTAEVFFALLHTKLDLSDYKKIRHIVSFVTAKEYYKFLVSKGTFSVGDDLAETVIRNKIATLGFLTTCMKKYALSVKEELAKDILTESAQERSIALILSVLEHAEEANQNLRLCYPMSGPKLQFRQTVLALNPLPIKPYTAPVANQPLRGTALLKWDVEIESEWPISPAECDNFLMTNINKIMKLLVEESDTDINGIVIFLNNIFRKMPRASAKYWKKIPYGDISSCMYGISRTSEVLLATRFECSHSRYHRVEEVCYMKKALAVVNFLKSRLTGSLACVANCQINTKRLSQDPKDENGASRFFLLKDPELEEELADTDKMLPKSEGMFNISFVRNQSGQFDRECVVNKNSLKDIYESGVYTDEVAFIKLFLEKNPENKKNVIDELRKWLSERYPWYDFSNVHFPEHLIIAMAITLDEEEYLPGAFIALKKQAYVTQCFFNDIHTLTKVGSSYSFCNSILDIRLVLPGGETNIATDILGENSSISVEPTFDFVHFPDFQLQPLGRSAYCSSQSPSPSEIERFLNNSHVYSKEDLTTNQLTLKQANQIHKELTVLFNPNEKSTQAARGLALFKKQHDERLKFSWRMVFESSLVGGLWNQLKTCPEFAQSLTASILRDYTYSIKCNDVEAALFFLRMGFIIDKYYNHIFKNDKKYLAEIQISSQQKLLDLEKNIRLNREGIISLNENIIAFFGRDKKFNLEFCGVLLQKIFISNDSHLNADPKLVLDKHSLLRHICTLFQQTLDEASKHPSSKKNNLSKLNQILSKAAFNQVDSDLEWDYSQFPLVSCKEGTFAIDLSHGVKYQSGLKSDRIKGYLLQDATFLSLFPRVEELKEISSDGMRKYLFKNKHNTQYLVQFIDSKWVFYRLTNEKWYMYYRAEDLSDLPSLFFKETCHCWQAPDQLEILFFDSHTQQLRYRFDRNKNILINLIDGPNKNLILSAREDSHQNLLDFDPFYLIWKDEKNEPRAIEFPYFELDFQINPLDKIAHITSKFSGYFRSENRHIECLKRIPGYVLLENGKNEKLVLLPPRILDSGSLSSRGYSEKFSFKKDSFKDKKGYNVYFLDINGELQSKQLAARLYLAYIYLAQRDYVRAFKILSESARKIKSYDYSELKWFDRILFLNKINSDGDDRAVALRLRAFFLFLDNGRRNIGGIGSKLSVNDLFKAELLKNYETYIRQPTHPKPFALDFEMEERLLKHVDSFQIGRRRQFLGLKQIDLKPGLENKNGLAKKGGGDPYRYFDNVILEDKVDAHILTKIAFVLRLDDLKVNFLSFYVIARHGSEQDKQKLHDLTRFAKFSHTETDADSRLLETLAVVLYYVNLNPQNFPSEPEIREQILSAEPNSNSKLLLNLIKKCDSKASELCFSQIEVPVQLEKTQQIPFEAIKHKKETALESSNLLGPLATDKFKKAFQFISDKESFSAKTQQDSNQQLLTKLAESESEQKDRVEKRGMRELIEDLKIYLKIPSSPLIKIDHHFLNLLHQDIIQDIDSRKKHAADHAAAILKMANKLPLPFDPKAHKMALLALKGNAYPPFSLEELFLLFYRGNAAALKERNPNLSSEDISLLADEIEFYKTKALDLKQLERAEPLFNRLLSMFGDENEASFQDLAHALIQELTQESAYNPRRFPQFQLFELMKNIRLRHDQISIHQNFVEHPKSNLIMQRSMGSGKTDIQLPLWAIENANGYYLSAIMVPEQLLDFLSNKMELNSGQIFHQMSHRIKWNRPLPEVIKRLKEIRDKREILLLTDDEMHGFALRYQEASNNGSEECSDLRIIKCFFKNRVCLFMDEVDILLQCRHESHQAKGQGKKIDQKYIDITTKIYDILLTDPKIISLVNFDFSQRKEPEAKAFTSKAMEEIKPILTEKMLTFLSELSEDLRKYLIEQPQLIKDFLMRPAEKDRMQLSLPEKMPLDVKHSLGFLRGQIQIFLASLNKIYRVHFGFVPLKKTCVPLRGANKSNNKTEFAEKTEIMDFTIQGYHMTSLPPDLVSEEMARYVNLNRLQLETSNGEQTAANRDYVSVVGEKIAKEYPLKLLRSADMPFLANRISEDPLLLNRFLNKHVLNSILVYSESRVSTPQSLPDMFFSVKGFSGTVSEKDTLPDRFKVIAEEGTDGKTVSLLWKNSRYAVSILSPTNERTKLENLEESSLAMFREMMKVDKFSVLIDKGALFVNVNHERLAKEILRMNPTLENVIYFVNDTQMVINRDLKVSTADTVDIKPDNLFIIFDELHCRGISIPMEARAIAMVTINKNMTLLDLFQGVWRMRGLAKSQKVHFFIPFEVREIIIAQLDLKADAELTAFEVILFVQKNQARQQADNNLFSIQQKMSNCVFQICMYFLDAVDVKELTQPIFRELHEVLLHKIGEETYELDILKKAPEALNEHKKQALAELVKWYHKYSKHELFLKYAKYFNSELIEKNIDSIIQNALIEGKEKVAEFLPVKLETGRGLTVQLKVDVRQQVNTRLEVNQNLTLKLHSPEELRNMTAVQDVPWLKPKEIFRKSYFQPMPMPEILEKSNSETVVTKSLLVAHAQKHEVNNVMTVSDAFLLNDKINAATVKHFIDKNLLISLNQIFTTERPFAFDKEISKAPGACLVIQNSKNPLDVQLLMISGEEAEFFKKILYEDMHIILKSPNDKKVALYFPEVGVTQQGSQPINIRELEENPLFQLLIVQYKFLSGETMAFSCSEQTILKKWLSTCEHVEDVEKLFRNTFLRDPKLANNYDSTLLKSIFTELKAEAFKKMDQADVKMSLSLSM